MRRLSSTPDSADASTSKLTRLRICLVTCFPPSRGDLNEYGFHLASALGGNADVELVLLADEIPFGEELKGFDVERCWRFDSLLTSARLLRAIRRAKPDVVWFNMGFSTFARMPVAAFLSITAPALARLNGFYTHVTLHTLFERINLRDAGVRLPSAYRMAGRVATRCLLFANDVSVLLPSFRSELIRNHAAQADRVHFRPHGIFSRRKVAHLQTEKDQRHSILAFGYWGTYKRLELLLESMEEVERQIPGVELLIAGLNHPSTPGYLESLQSKYAGQSNIKFLGYVPEDDLPSLFRQASVLVLPYTSAAGTSGVVHQACEYGLPMVAGAIPEIQEIAREHALAIEFYSPGDRAALTNQLVRILKSELLCQELAQQNLSAGNVMQISEVVGGYLNLFKSRARSRKHSRSTRLASAPRLDHTVGNWFLHSGIADTSGGVARYYLSDAKQNKPVSTEITGYCVSALILLNEHTGDFRYWDGAIQSAKFLAKAWDPGCMAMPFECEPEVQKYSYFFDTGIIVRGLLAAWRKSGHAALLSVATLCGECIAYDFFDDRNFHPILTLPDKKPLPHEESRWSRSPGCYQLKAALALRELSEVIHEDRFSELYHRLLQWSLASHRSFLPGATSPLAVMDRLHAYSYFLEGLLPMVNEAECLVAMRSGIETLSHYATEIAPQFLRSDVIAQLLRVRIFADCAGVVPLNPSVARREAALLLEFQSEAPDPRLAGGFWFGRKEKMLPFMNPVSTAFCYQALAMWDLYQKGERRFDWRNLI